MRWVVHLKDAQARFDFRNMTRGPSRTIRSSRLPHASRLLNSEKFHRNTSHSGLFTGTELTGSRVWVQALSKHCATLTPEFIGRWPALKERCRRVTERR